MTLQLQSTAGLLTVAGTGTVNAGAAAGEEGVAVAGSREDLTVFFSIGVAVDVLLVAAFLVWAVRQWRKSGK